MVQATIHLNTFTERDTRKQATIHYNRFTKSDGISSSEFFVIRGGGIIGLDEPEIARSPEELTDKVLDLVRQNPGLLLQSKIPYGEDIHEFYMRESYLDGCSNKYWILQPEQIPAEIRGFVEFPYRIIDERRTLLN